MLGDVEGEPQDLSHFSQPRYASLPSQSDHSSGRCPSWSFYKWGLSHRVASRRPQPPATRTGDSAYRRLPCSYLSRTGPTTAPKLPLVVWEYDLIRCPGGGGGGGRWIHEYTAFFLPL